MRLIFVHGWSVTHTNTYGGLPEAISNLANSYGIDLNIQHVYLGKYISFHDEVTVDDISRAMDYALRDLPGNNVNIQEFSCITHSTGGPVVRHWIDRYYGAKNLQDLPLKHLVMLAPANHGSTLAVLGKARVGRIKAWWSDIEPGQKVLDWLCLGSEGQWSLNYKYLKYKYTDNNFFPFVLTGQGIDESLYDFLNDYLVEPGSDGVVRVAGANMNYRYLSLVQNITNNIPNKTDTFALEPKGRVKMPMRVPLAIYNNYSHSGTKKGIMRSVKKNDTNKAIVKDILECLKVDSSDEYDARYNDFKHLSDVQQEGKSKYCMLMFNIKDDQGNQIKYDDYDLFLLAGEDYKEDLLPKGFFKDRQMNTKTSRLVYYLDANKMSQIKDGMFGLRVVARPQKGFSYYRPAEFHSDGISALNVLVPNETTYVDVILHRFVDENVFRFDPASNKTRSFKPTKPSGKNISED